MARRPVCSSPSSTPCRTPASPAPALNKPDDFILALVLFGSGDDDTPRVRYVRRPFQREPDFGAASVNYALKDLPAKRGRPAATRAAGPDRARLNGRDTTTGRDPHAAGEGDGSAVSISAPRASPAVRQEAVDGVEVCEACGMLRVTSFRTGRPSLRAGGRGELGRCSTTVTATAGRFLTTGRGSGRRAG